MKILFLHGWQSVPGGVKPTFLKDHGHEVINPKLPDEDFAEAVRIAQAEFDGHQPQAVVGSSRGGAVAMNINSGEAKLVLLCPAWRKYGTARTVKPGTVILHSRADDVVPFADSEELARNSGADVDRGRHGSPAGRPGAAGGDVEGVREARLIPPLNSNGINITNGANMAPSGWLACCDPNGIFKARQACVEPKSWGHRHGRIRLRRDLFFAVECVNADGMTVWLADFFAEELEFILENPASRHGQSGGIEQTGHESDPSNFRILLSVSRTRCSRTQGKRIGIQVREGDHGCKIGTGMGSRRRHGWSLLPACLPTSDEPAQHPRTVLRGRNGHLRNGNDGSRLTTSSWTVRARSSSSRSPGARMNCGTSSALRSASASSGTAWTATTTGPWD